jgi:hypothetical protein
MRSLAALLGVALLCPLGGCGSSEDADRLVESYRSTLRKGQREQQKILGILESVKDQASAAEALKQLREEYERAALHPPMREPPSEMQERLQEEYAKLLQGRNRLLQEISRIRTRVPGGAEFLNEIEKLKPPQRPWGP